MLITFGSIAMTLTMGVNRLPDINEIQHAGDYRMAAGGKGANQALAAVRAGADKVALVGKISDDEMSSQILTKIRREGVMTSGVGQSALPTSAHVIIRDPSGRTLKIVTQGSNSEVTHEQIPDEILGPKALLLLQTDLPAAENTKLLERAKALGTRTVMNLGPSIEMTKKTLKNIDYLIVNHEEAKKLAAQLDLKVESNALRMAEGLAKLGELHCIVTLGERGSIAVTPDLTMWEIPALPIEDVIDHDGAEDAYCGTFAACIYNSLPFARALKRASVAGSLACTKPGVQESFPYLDDIEKHLGGLEDPKQVKL